MKKRTKPKPEWMLRREEQIKRRVILTIVISLDVIAIAIGFIIWRFDTANANEVPSLYAGVAMELQSIETNQIEKSETVDVIEAEDVEVTEQSFTDQERYELAKIIYCEAGADYVSARCRYYVGSVVLNRVNSEYFPDSIHEVIMQQGQYQPTFTGGTWWNSEPNFECLEIAQDLLTNGSVLPSNVIFQAGFVQGDGIYCETDGVYFCYKD